MSPDNDKDDLFSRYIARESNNLFSKMPPPPLSTTTSNTSNTAAINITVAAAAATNYFGTATFPSTSIFNLDNPNVSQAMLLNQHQQQRPPDDRISASQASASASMDLYRAQQLVASKQKELADLAILRRLRHQDEHNRLRQQQQQQGWDRKESSLLLNNRDDALKGMLMSMLSTSPAPAPAPAPAAAAEESLRAYRLVEGILTEQEKEKILRRAANQQLVLQQQHKQQHQQQELMMLDNIRRRESASAISDSKRKHHGGDDNTLLMNHIQNIVREQNNRMVLPAGAATATASTTSNNIQNIVREQNNRMVLPAGAATATASTTSNSHPLPSSVSSVSSGTSPSSIFGPSHAASRNSTSRGGMTLADQKLLSLHHYYNTANASGVSRVATSSTSSPGVAATITSSTRGITNPNVTSQLTGIVDGFHHRVPAPAIYLPSSVIANAQDVTRRREREKQQRVNDLLNTTRATKRFKKKGHRTREGDGSSLRRHRCE